VARVVSPVLPVRSTVEVGGSTPVETIKFYTMPESQPEGATWQPMTGPRGTSPTNQTLLLVEHRMVHVSATYPATCHRTCPVSLLTSSMPCQPVPRVTLTVEFDGSHSSFGSGAGIVLTAPSGEVFYHSYRLEFYCTNNVAEYEALILGLNLAIDKGVTILEVKGDSDLIVSQVLMRFATKNERLKRYRDVAQALSKSFKKISI
jgi:hypothetical protein